jgi:hypothetical protein
MHPWIWRLWSRYAIYGASCCVYAIYGGPGLGSFPAARAGVCRWTGYGAKTD